MKKIISVLGLPILGLLFYVLQTHVSFSIPCIFHKITGFYCPGCGMGRCIISIFQGQWEQAFRYNMFGFLLLPFLLFYLEEQLLCWGFEKKSHIMQNSSSHGLPIVLYLLIVYGILRNFPFCNWLAPTIIP